ncbi:hypothetical protein [Microbacterium sp.]|uniref:hypothetical protein n=1 Tax=Microbacterium sp. TaxID=51671 RepID=UPI0035B467F6
MTRSDDSLTSPYRAVRPIGAPGDGPWPGMLTCLPSGERRVLVDIDVVGTEWGGWDAAPGGHVLGALDVVRRQGGHDVELPVCPESVDSYLARRRASRHPLAPGEAVTLGVSLLRGCAELLPRRPGPGGWWLTETGRPVFATDAAPSPVRESTLLLLDELSRATPHPTAWADAAAAVSAVRVSAAELDQAELGVFAIAAPAPLDLGPTPATGAGEPEVLRGGAVETAESEPRRGLWEALARHVDADLADAVSRTTTSIWRRARAAPTTRRRAPLLVGAGVAAAVVGVGLMWPSASGEVATAGDGHRTLESLDAPSPTGSESPAASPAASPSVNADPSAAAVGGADADAAAPEDLEAIAAGLLANMDACGEDGECRAALAMDGAEAPVQVGIPPDRRAVVILDDFGGVAVLRVDDASGELPSQLVVIARQNGEWLLRDVHDATQQP